MTDGEFITKAELEARLAGYPDRNEVRGMVDRALKQQQHQFADVVNKMRDTADRNHQQLDRISKMMRAHHRKLDRALELAETAEEKASRAQYDAGRAVAGFDVVTARLGDMERGLREFFSIGMNELKAELKTHDDAIEHWQQRDKNIATGLSVLGKLFKPLASLTDWLFFTGILAVLGAAFHFLTR